MSTRYTNELLNYVGTSPFGEAQGRDVSDTKLLGEFYPTSTFWNRFNSQHEILIGSRGSGKTFLLRLLSYSCLRRLEHEKAQEIVKQKSFLGFYLPLHLEFMAAIEGDDGLYERRTGYFTFAFNCAAIMAFLNELRPIIVDSFATEEEQISAEFETTKALSKLWFPNERKLASIEDIKSTVNCLFYNQPRWLDGDDLPLPRFTEECLRPISFALLEVNRTLRIDPNVTSWLACIDEAEFVKEPFQRCINTILRSAKRPLVVKLATLPFKHVTRSTSIHGVAVEPHGNDFNYRSVDLVHDGEDFIGVTNHLCRCRLSRCLQAPPDTLEDFFGIVGKNDSLIDYYRAEMGEVEAQEDSILENIVDELSDARQRNSSSGQEDRASMMKPIYNRFYPVYFCRRLKREARGNRVVGWFAGAKVCRMVADGNPRRFIQLMNDLFEEARKIALTPKRQHRVISAFCERALVDSQGLPELGHVAKELLKTIGARLAERVHGASMVDGGCGFSLDQRFLEHCHLVDALKLAIAYSHIICTNVADGEVTEHAEMRLSYVHAVNYWLPMRKGQQLRLRPTEDLKNLHPARKSDLAPLTKQRSRDLVRKLQLQLFLD